MYYHVATDVKRCVLRGGKDDDFYDQSKTKKSGRGGSRTFRPSGKKKLCALPRKKLGPRVQNALSLPREAKSLFLPREEKSVCLPPFTKKKEKNVKKMAKAGIDHSLHRPATHL